MSASQTLVRCESCGARFEISTRDLVPARWPLSPLDRALASSPHTITLPPRVRALCPVDLTPLVEVKA